MLIHIPVNNSEPLEDITKEIYFEKNMKTRGVMEERYIEKEKEYREKTGYNDTIRARQRSRTEIDPNLIQLPKYVIEDILENTGKGLELTCIINLFAYKNLDKQEVYAYTANIHDRDRYLSAFHFHTMKGLVSDVKKYIKEESNKHNRAELKPLFITEAEDDETQPLTYLDSINMVSDLFSEGELNTLFDILKENDINTNLTSNNRCLNSDEIKEFIELYNE